jgi:hypothetical protein
MVVQPLGTIDPDTGRVHADLEMEQPNSLVLEWRDEANVPQSTTLALPPVPVDFASTLTLHVVQTGIGQFHPPTVLRAAI